MSNFSHIEQIAGAELLEEHQFPLYELTGLFQRLHFADKAISVECIIVDLRQAQGKTEEEILNLVVASGYVSDDSDITFRCNENSDYFYTYFNFIDHNSDAKFNGLNKS